MREFPEFSVLDYINLNIDWNMHKLTEQKKKRIKINDNNKK